ncbi:MAG TPA: phosphatase domain-containing protein [Thermoanaerobaculia bacterium]
MVKRTLHRAVHALDRQFDRRRRPARGGRIIVSPYRGFGRDGELGVRGRVLVEKPITTSAGNEPLWRSVVNTYRRFATDEVAGARIRATYRDAVAETTSDDEGYFQLLLQPNDLALNSLWHEVGLALPDHGTTCIAQALIPSQSAQFAIISDIDDTVLVTNATSLLGMARSVIRNAASRLPFEGVAELYRALHRDVNPIFYVSSSPWNLYELLHEFMDLNGIPHGPMMLQDWGIDESTLIIAPHETHKMAQINRIIEYYPELKFVLIGDSGQHDPEIYLRVIQSHPNRVLAAFIRDVTPDLRDHAVARILEQSNAAGVEMLYVRNSSEALEHARRMQLV